MKNQKRAMAKAYSMVKNLFASRLLPSYVLRMNRIANRCRSNIVQQVFSGKGQLVINRRD